MRSVHSEMGPKDVVFAIALEFLFLCLCAILIGLGLSELRKGKNRPKNLALVIFGFILAAGSLYMAKLLIQG